MQSLWLFEASSWQIWAQDSCIVPSAHGWVILHLKYSGALIIGHSRENMKNAEKLIHSLLLNINNHLYFLSSFVLTHHPHLFSFRDHLAAITKHHSLQDFHGKEYIKKSLLWLYWDVLSIPRLQTYEVNILQRVVSWKWRQGEGEWLQITNCPHRAELRDI